MAREDWLGGKCKELIIKSVRIDVLGVQLWFFIYLIILRVFKEDIIKWNYTTCIVCIFGCSIDNPSLAIEPPMILGSRKVKTGYSWDPCASPPQYLVLFSLFIPKLSPWAIDSLKEFINQREQIVVIYHQIVKTRILSASTTNLKSGWKLEHGKQNNILPKSKYTKKNSYSIKKTQVFSWDCHYLSTHMAICFVVHIQNINLHSEYLRQRSNSSTLPPFWVPSALSGKCVWSAWRKTGWCFELLQHRIDFSESMQVIPPKSTRIVRLANYNILKKKFKVNYLST